jgi:hypothetical protein
VYYKLNGGSEILFTTNGNNVDDFTSKIASTFIPAGNTLQIIVRMKNDSKGKQHRIDDVIVTGTSLFVVVPTLTPSGCLGSRNGSISLVTSGGTPPLSYSWSNGQTTQNISGLAGGNYTITITDNNGHNAAFTYKVNGPLDTLKAFGIATSKQPNVNDGTVNSIVVGGTPPFTYLWSTAETTSDISGLNAGTYTVTVTDVGGCSVSASATVYAYTNLVNTWTGNSSTSWTISSNWSKGVVPTLADSVIIPAGLPRYPSVGAATTASCGYIEIKSGGSLTITSGTLDIYGDIIINGTFTAGTGTVRFLGNSEIAYASNKKVTFYNLVVNNSSSRGVQLKKSIIVSNNIVLTNGIVYTNNDTIFAANTSANAITGFNDNSFVDGIFTRSIIPNSSLYVFPLGKEVNGQRKQFNIAIQNNNLTGVSSLTAFFRYKPSNEDTIVDINDTEIYISKIKGEGIWTVEPNSQPTNGSYDVKLYIGNFSGLVDNQFSVLKRPHRASKSEWSDGGGSKPDANDIGRRVSDGFALLKGLTSFSDFGVGGGGGGGLPIKLADFSGKQVDDERILLEWKTMVEINNDYFTIEKANENKSFYILGTITGAGNSSLPLKYNMIDSDPVKGVNYYRLKQTDFDGKSAYHKTIAVNYGIENNIINSRVYNIYPNPSNGNFDLEFQSSDIINETKIYVINAAGQVVKTFSHPAEKGILKTIRFQLNETLSNGIYNIVIEENGEKYFKKMVIHK